MEQLGFFPTSYTAIWNVTDVSSIAPVWRDLNPGRFSNRATTAGYSKVGNLNLNLLYYLSLCYGYSRV